MVRRMFNIVYQEVRGLHQAAYVLALFAFGSQLLALFRDRLLAHLFGAGATLDIYYSAFRIPDLLYVLLASTLSVYVLIPFVSRAREKNGDRAAQLLLSQVFSIFLVVYFAVAILLFIFIPYLSPWLFPGIEDQTLLVTLSRILLLQPLFLGVSSLFGVVTQLGHRFVLYAVSPLIYNIGIIIGIAFFYPVFGLIGLGYGVVLGAIGHMLIQWPLVQASALRFSWQFNIVWSDMRDILKLSIPRAITLSLGQIVLLVLVSFASVMTVGSVSVFQFAYNLQSVPLAIIGVSYSVAAFPMLAELYAKKQYDLFSHHLATALRHVIFWSVPAIALIIVLRAQLVRVVLGSGAFDWADTRLTAAVLALLSLTLLAQVISLLIVRAFYASGRTWLPFFITLFGSVLAIVSAFGFYMMYKVHPEIHFIVAAYMRLEGVTGSEVLALAFGYSLAVIVQSVILFAVFSWIVSFKMNGLLRSLIVSLMAAIVGGISAYIALNFFVVGINPETFVGIFIQGFLAGVVGCVGILLTYAGFNSPELNEVYASFHKKLFKTDVVAPQADIL
jgi:putative peptidoglycan lipid II flippase